MTALTSTGSKANGRTKRIHYNPRRNFVIFMFFSVFEIVKRFIFPAIGKGMTVGEFYERFEARDRLFATAFGSMKMYKLTGSASLGDVVWWAFGLALVTLVFTVIAELGQSREFEPSGKNPIASILAGGVFFLASILGEGVIAGIEAFLFCVFVTLCVSAFLGFGGIFLLGKVSGFFGSWLPNVLHFVLFASGKYLVALPIIDWAIQKSRVVQKCIYLPMVFISAGLNGICFLYYSVLDDILAGLHLMSASSAGMLALSGFLMYLPIFLVIYFTMVWSVNIGRKPLADWEWELEEYVSRNEE